MGEENRAAMDLKTFFQHFDTLAEAPNGVQRLRELILDMAVRGKLVEQDAGDEDASILLQKIQDEIKRKSIRKKRKVISKIVNFPFLLPNGWLSVKLEDISIEVHYGLTASANNESKKIKFLRITDIQNNSVNWSSVPGCDVSLEKANKYRLCNNDIVIARTGGTVGKSYLVESLDEKDFAVFASYLIRVVPSSEINHRYLKLTMETSLYWNQLSNNTSGTGQPNVNATSLKGFLLPLPPLAEQKRIVAKVDELMALCDALEAAQQQRNALRQSLRASALDRLMNASGDDELETAWGFVCDRWADLSRQPEDVEGLRRAVLQLAVLGKLQSSQKQAEATDQESSKEKLWKKLKLEDLAIQIKTGPFGTMLHKRDYIDSGIPVVNPENMKDGLIKSNPNKTISNKKFLELRDYQLSVGDLVVARRGELGRCSVVTEAESGWLCGTGSLFLRFSNIISPEFIALILRSPYGRTYLGGASVGVTMNNLSQKALRNLGHWSAKR